MIVLVSCFLTVFCSGYPHRKHEAVPPQPIVLPSENVGTVQQDTRGKSCDQIIKDFDGRNRDDWVSEFPVDQQHRVLVCLDRRAKAKGRGND